MSVRFKIPDFELANAIYAAATVTFYTVDASGIKTSTKATLYDAVTGSVTLSNPQALDSEGKFSAPVYSDVAIIASVTGLTIPDHDTGVIAPSWNFLGAWVTSTIYAVNDVVSITASEDSAKDGNLYVCSARHTSSTFATDRDTNSYWTEFVDITLVKDWAKKTGSTVDGAGYSAKEHAVGTSTRGLSGGGSSKDWASYIGGTVDNADYSAKKHATDASSSAAAADNSAIAAAASASSIRWHDRAKAATTANITLSAAQTIDGIALVAGDRCLVKDQTTPAENGIYVVAAGAWTRATDMDAWTEVPSAALSVEQGTTNADRHYICSSDSGGTLGTTAIAFAQFGAGGINNLVDDLTPQLGGNLDLNGKVIAGLVIGTDVLAPNGDGSALTGIAKGATAVEKSNIMLNAFRIEVNGGLSFQNMVDGVSDTFIDETGVDTATSTNETFDGTNHLYSNGGASTTLTQQSTDGSNANSAATPLAQSFQVTTTNAISKARWYSYGNSSATTFKWTIETDNAGLPSGTLVDANMTLTQAGLGAAGWQDIVFPGSWTPATGTTYWLKMVNNAGGNVPVNTWQLNAGAGSYASGRAIGGGATSASDNRFGIYQSSATLNMTLVSNASTALSVPTSAFIVIEEEDVDAVTLNTDLIPYASRDGGTTWTLGTLAVAANLTTGRILTATIDISAQPSGTSMKYKIETLNTKWLKIHSVAIEWS